MRWRNGVLPVTVAGEKSSEEGVTVLLENEAAILSTETTPPAAASETQVLLCLLEAG